MRDLFAILIAINLCALAGSVQAYDPADYEEWGGMSFAAYVDPDGDVYGGGFESGVWLKGTPVFGEISATLFKNRLQRATYYGIGFTLRLMPHTEVAPFVGAGGSYNRIASEDRRDALDPEREADRYYWAGHAEGGVRFWFGRDRHFIEALYRQVWTETRGDFDYGLIGIEYGRLF